MGSVDWKSKDTPEGQVTRKQKRRRFTACVVKKVHYDFLSAIGHCRALEAIEPNAHVTVYKCDYCPGMHVTRGRACKNIQKIRALLDQNIKLMTLEWWFKCPPNVRALRIRKEIDALNIILGLKDHDR